ncbi:MAG: thioesterase family protein [Chloroflexi bacterium]|nr:thioesterase family protein [Chloroflexota bacterium]
MPRVTLTEQQNYEFSHSLTVRPTDINYAGHLGNEALLGLVHEARAYFLKELNFNTIVGNEQRIGLLIADLAVNFKAEAFAHDQLTVDCQIDELQEKSFRLFHRIRCGEQVITLVETGVVAYDYQSGHVVPLPDDFLNGLQNFRRR